MGSNDDTASTAIGPSGVLPTPMRSRGAGLEDGRGIILTDNAGNQFYSHRVVDLRPNPNKSKKRSRIEEQGEVVDDSVSDISTFNAAGVSAFNVAAIPKAAPLGVSASSSANSATS